MLCLIALITGCNSDTPQRKAEKLINRYLENNLKDPDSYERMGSGVPHRTMMFLFFRYWPSAGVAPPSADFGPRFDPGRGEPCTAGKSTPEPRGL